VELKYVFIPLREEFQLLFGETFSMDANSKFMSHIMNCYMGKKWKELLALMLHVHQSALTRLSSKKQKKAALIARYGIKTLNHVFE